MAALNGNAPVPRRRVFVDQTIQHWTTELEEAQQAFVEYMENTREPEASRERELRKRIDYCRTMLARFVAERAEFTEGRAPVLRQRVGRRPFVPFRRRSHSRGRRSSRVSSRSSSSSRSSRSSSSSRGSRSPNRGTRRRSRCPRGSNCTIS